MSFDLYAWKRPVVETEEEALVLLEGDVSAFEPSPDLQALYDEVCRRWPAETSDELEGDGDRPAWGVTMEPSDRLLELSFTWSVPGDVLDAIVEVARERELVLFDPQGPTFHSPPSLDPPAPVRRDPRVLIDVSRGLLIGAALVAGGWFLPLPVLDWILIVIGGFLLLMTVVTVVGWLRE